MTDQSGHESPNTMPQMPADNRKNDPASLEAEREARYDNVNDANKAQDQEPDENGPNNKRNKR